MKVDCISCGYEINLDHKIFDDYSGPIKCFSCGSVMEVTIEQGSMRSAMHREISPFYYPEERRLRAVA